VKVATTDFEIVITQIAKIMDMMHGAKQEDMMVNATVAIGSC
jgi:hypothetical protein